MSILITRFVWFNRGLRKFEEEVVCRLSENQFYTVTHLEATPGLFGFRWLVTCIIEKGVEQP